MPNTVWAMTLRRRDAFGFGVFEAAIPAPMPGCITKNGAISVKSARIKAGASVGWRAQSSPHIARSKAA